MVLTARTALWVVPVSDLAGVARHVLDVAGAGLPGWRLTVLAPPGPLPDRLVNLWRSGVYRQTALGQVSLYAAGLLGKL